MALPKIDLPLFNITIPSTGKQTKFRPFTVKEEKILLIAQESKDIGQIITGIKQILNNTVQDIDVDKLATFDIEYLLLHIRGQSVNNIIEFGIEDPVTEEKLELKFDINDIEIKKSDKHSNIIKINDNASIIMRYPTLDEIRQIVESDNREESLFNILLGCIDSIVNEDEIYNAADFSNEEIIEFMDQLSNTVINDMKTFFETMPVLKIEIPYKNKNGEDKKFVIEGMDSFFI